MITIVTNIDSRTIKVYPRVYPFLNTTITYINEATLEQFTEALFVDEYLGYLEVEISASIPNPVVESNYEIIIKEDTTTIYRGQIRMIADSNVGKSQIINGKLII